MPQTSTSEVQSNHELIVMSEAQYASMRSEAGAKVIERDGRYWEMPIPGFYKSIHLLARFRAEELRRPSLMCWGYRAGLTDEDAPLANASIPVHLFNEVRQFKERALPDCRREDLRRSRRQVEVRRELDPARFLEQGWEVFNSAQLRVPHGRHTNRDEYLLNIGKKVSDPRWIFMVGLIDGVLAGYSENFAVDGTLYSDEVYIATDRMRTGIGTGLDVELIRLCSESQVIDRICWGLHCPHLPGITAYKNTLGSLVQVPARWSMPYLVESIIKSRDPLRHYHLRGLDLSKGPIHWP